MKDSSLKHSLFLASLCMLSSASHLSAQGTAFTYQGRLNDGGRGANGSYDLQFSVYDSTNVPGSVVAGPITSLATTVNDGLFTVTLDFGGNVFGGGARWLEIAARTNGAGAFTKLAPRQQISAAPYAITASEVTGSVAAEQLIGTIQSARIGPGSIHSNHIAIGSIHSNLLAVGAIHSNHLAAGSIHSNALALGSVTAAALAAGSVHSNILAPGSVTTAALTVGAIHSNHIAFGSIHSNLLAVGAIHSNHIAPGSIHSNLLAVGAIHSNHIAIGSIHSNLLAVGAIHSNHLAAGSIHSNALAFGSVTAAALAAGSVHSNILAPGSVTATALAAGSVHSNILAPGSVTTAALAAGSIHSNHIAVGSIHSNLLAIGAIHSNHIAPGSIHSNLLAVGAIHSNHIAAGSIHSNLLAVGSVTAAALAAGSVHSNILAPGSVTTVALAAGSIHSNQLAVGAVSFDKLETAFGGSFSTTLTEPNAGFFQYFGGTVAAMGTDKLLVGAYQNSTGADNAGAAYLLSTSGALLQTFLKPIPQNQDRFGFAVAAVGEDMALIGADADDAGALDAGAAYLFNTSGALITAFTNPTPATADSFGYAVAAVGADKVLIGAFGDHFGANAGGAAYLFSTNRTLLATFNNPSPTSGDRFGVAVAAVGADKVLIGADRDDTGATDAGVAYLFHISGALLTTLTNPTPVASDFFGSAVTSVGSDKVLVGTPGDNSAGNAGGAAYLFSTSGALLRTFNNPTPLAGDQFGIAVAAIGADKLLIGAASDDSGATDAGAAYLFSADGALLSTLNNPAPGTGDYFGNALTAVGSDAILIGAPDDDGGGVTDSGAVHLFALNKYVPGLTLGPSVGSWQKSGAHIFYNSGNVGIGTSNPEYPLDVAGPVRITKVGAGAEILNLNTERSWSFRQLNSGASTALELASVGGGGNKNFVINTTGFVGIGTTTPQATLHVVGNNSQLRLQDSGVGNYWSIYTENHPSGADGNLLFVPGPTGTFAYIRKSDGNYFSGSDARLKTDIRGLSGVLDRVLRLRPVSYRFKSAPASATPALGFIAQEVEPLFPEVVDEQSGLKSLAYSELVPVTVGAIQELNRKLTEELKRRDAENAELKRSIEEIKTLVNALSRHINGGGQ